MKIIKIKKNEYKIYEENYMYIIEKLGKEDYSIYSTNDEEGYLKQMEAGKGIDIGCSTRGGKEIFEDYPEIKRGIKVILENFKSNDSKKKTRKTV